MLRARNLAALADMSGKRLASVQHALSTGRRDGACAAQPAGSGAPVCHLVFKISLDYALRFLKALREECLNRPTVTRAHAPPQALLVPPRDASLLFENARCAVYDLRLDEALLGLGRTAALNRNRNLLRRAVLN